MLSNSVWWLRVIAAIEGISWVILAFVAVPLKYAADNPFMVKLMGPIHGALFTLFCVILAMAWGANELAIFSCSADLSPESRPFGWLFVDKWLKTEVSKSVDEIDA